MLPLTLLENLLRKTGFQSRLCVHVIYFPGRPTDRTAVVTVQWTVTGRKKPRPFSRGFVFALLIFPGSHPPSIVSVHVLNFCVRDGNRWTHMTINTNYVVAFTTFSKDLVTHTGFEPMLTA